MNIKGLLIYLGLVIVGVIIVILYEKYGPDDDNDEPTPPGFRWGD
jgi:hypothetical protein